jgi:hypothetical protein
MMAVRADVILERISHDSDEEEFQNRHHNRRQNRRQNRGENSPESSTLTAFINSVPKPLSNGNDQAPSLD